MEGFLKVLPTILIGLVVLGVFALALMKVVRDRKKGSCGCGCSGCANEDACHR